MLESNYRVNDDIFYKGIKMTKYKYIIYENGLEIFDSYEEYGDDDYNGTFYDEDAASDAALEYIGNTRAGGDIMELMGDRDNIIDADDLDYSVEEIDI